MKETDNILRPLASMLMHLIDVQHHDYYRGPFQFYEDLKEEGATDWDIAPLLQLLQPAPLRILEIGSGSGRIAFHLARLGHNVTALDVSQEACLRLSHAISDQGVENITPVLGDALEAESIGLFDAIIIGNLSINLFPEQDLQRLLHFVLRNIRPGGMFCLGAFTGMGVQSFDALLSHRVHGAYADCYNDEEGMQRVMLSWLRYHPPSARLVQNWLVDMGGSRLHARRFHVATASEKIWSSTDLKLLLARANFELEQQVDTQVKGGGAHNQPVHMARYRHHGVNLSG